MERLNKLSRHTNHCHATQSRIAFYGLVWLVRSGWEYIEKPRSKAHSVVWNQQFFQKSPSTHISTIALVIFAFVPAYCLFDEGQGLNQIIVKGTVKIASMALQAYRNLLRSTRIAFHGDLPLLIAARQEARNGFRKNAALTPEDPALATAIAHAEEVAQILKQNVVQGKNIGDNKYKLNIHEHTERGDNDTIKMPNGKRVVIDGKTCMDQ